MTEWICFPADASAVQCRTSDAGFGTRRRPTLALADPQLVFRRSPPGQDQQIPSGIEQLLQRQDRYGDRIRPICAVTIVTEMCFLSFNNQ